MNTKYKQSKNFITLLIVGIMLIGAFLPMVQANEVDYIQGCDKGPSYTNVVPLKKTTFVNYDNETYLDDYAYLASVPTSVFNYQNKLYSYPLLFFQEELEIEDDKERSLNAYQGLDYFMEDWMQYSGERLDEMTLINMDKKDIPREWDAKEYNTIQGSNPYDLAKNIAIKDWSYSDNAVISVIEENFEESEVIYEGEVNGTISNTKIKELEPFYSEQLDKLNPRPHYFDVPDEYKFLSARTWWSSIWFGTPKKSDLPLSLNITIPAADPDSQFFCQHENGQWMQVAVTQGWNIDGMDKERAQTYIYNDGQWYFTITDIPTFGIKDFFGSFGNILDTLRNMIKGARYQTDITLYPGVDKTIKETPPFGCRDVTFKLTTDNENAKIGFSILGPSGEEIISSVGKHLSVDVSDSYEIHLDQLGECPEGKNYKISAYLLEDVSKPVKFKVEYSWHQNITEAEGDALASATEGAVLASSLNAPLLYTSADSLPQTTKDALYKLGVKTIYLVNIGNHIKSDIRKDIKNIAGIKEEYTELTQIYDKIMETTGQNDIIFTTIDPWTRWLVTECKPHDETKAGLFIGPAAYCAAHHGSPVIITDMHPEISSNVVWHTEFWKRHSRGFPEPTVACMYLTVSNVVKFLQKIGIDLDRGEEGVESMITIAGQYDIGATWDRAFVGNTNPGRIYGSPVDTAYWISRNMFYPELIFNNPGMNPNGVTLEQGSSSERRTLLPWGSFGLKVTEGKEENFKYPVLQLFLTYAHNLNDAYSKYYGFKYKTRDNIVPGVTESDDTIDAGVVKDMPGQMIWPEFSESEIAPYYFSKSGYDNVFSTDFDVMTENLNKGVLLFLSISHGTGGNSGVMFSWDPPKSSLSSLVGGLKLFGYQKESNPWRGYDWLLGSTENPDAMTMEVHGFLPALLGNPNIDGLFPTGEDFWPSERPILHSFGKLLKLIPGVKRLVPDWLADSSYYKDGMVGSHTISGLATTTAEWTGYNWDDKLQNVHSVGWLNGACLPAYKLMHLTMVRHGSVFQIIDPWPTSWYMYWSETIPKDIALGYTIGEAYRRGISHVGILYATDPPGWWWDSEQNLCFFGDPDLRIYVPESDYSDANTWEKEDTDPLLHTKEYSFNGHMPYGATEYPNAKEQKTLFEEYLFVIIIVIIILLLIVGLALTGRKKRK